jgi:large subunit ribosomal protein L24
MALKIVKGDTVEVISGDDKGQRGTVQRVIRKKTKEGAYDPNRVYVIVSGVNMAIKHQRPTGRVRTQTGRIEKEMPLHISNVMLVGSDNKPTRTGYDLDADGTKTRIDRRTGNPLPKPTAK